MLVSGYRNNEVCIFRVLSGFLHLILVLYCRDFKMSSKMCEGSLMPQPYGASAPQTGVHMQAPPRVQTMFFTACFVLISLYIGRPLSIHPSTRPQNHTQHNPNSPPPTPPSCPTPDLAFTETADDSHNLQSQEQHNE
jgi:hypothetical protein